jgi:hypothetical protein
MSNEQTPEDVPRARPVTTCTPGPVPLARPVQQADNPFADIGGGEVRPQGPRPTNLRAVARRTVGFLLMGIGGICLVPVVLVLAVVWWGRLPAQTLGLTGWLALMAAAGVGTGLCFFGFWMFHGRPPRL